MTTERWKGLCRKLAGALNRRSAEYEDSQRELAFARNELACKYAEVDGLEWQVEELEDENDKLLKLVSQMYRDMQDVLDMSTDTVFVDSIGTLRDRMDLHMQAMAELGVPPMDYEQRMRELGMEADE